MKHPRAVFQVRRIYPRGRAPLTSQSKLRPAKPQHASHCIRLVVLLWLIPAILHLHGLVLDHVRLVATGVYS